MKPQTRTNATPNRNGYVPSYVPSYIPPPEPPKPPPAPNVEVENNIEIPEQIHVEAASMSDLVEQIIANAAVLFPGASVKVTTAFAPPRRSVGSSLIFGGNVCHALLVAPKNEERPTSRYKLLMKGPGVSGIKARPAEQRRQAIAGMLEEVERRVGKELLRPGA
ncbi:hypothetical protein H2199_002998 [Coniosporium tulheliwenetii]|uniref:Uncharacterized protein n=1 Tax=Coniosporium tulheliwenetii TaxID=3383036 RepID=A0ACC2ZE18_9PEZI|nr:hypothetical protein H2199_002998 [Cladosporium sp. JES 115]